MELGLATFHFLQGRALEAVGAHDRAWESYLRALRVEPASVEVIEALKTTLSRLEGDRGPHLDKLAALDPVSVDLLRILASHDLQSGDHRRARGWYERLVARLPDEREGWIRLGECALKQNDLAGAREALLKALARFGDRDALRWLHKVAQLQAIQKDPEEALATYQGILAASPGEPMAQMGMLRLVYRSGDLEAALATYHRLGRGDAQEAVVDGILQRIHRARELRDARLEELILEGVDPGTVPETVRIEVEEGPLRVRVPSGFAGRLKPVYSLEEQREIRRRIVERYLGHGATERALFHLGQFKPRDREDEAWARAWRGILMLRQGRLDEAREDLLAVELEALSGRGRAHLKLLHEVGLARMQTGALEAARQAFKRVILLDIGYGEAAAMLELIERRSRGAPDDAGRTRFLRSPGRNGPAPDEAGETPERVLGDRYAVVETVHNSLRGTVHRGVDRSLGRPVALRELAPVILADPRVLERFVEQARRSTALGHPVTVPFTDVLAAEGRTWLVRDWVVGEPLEVACAREPLRPRDLVDLGVQVAGALGHAAALGILHLDLKPSEILVVDRSRMRVKVLDFGLSPMASILDHASGPEQLRRCPWFSPELIRGDRQDVRSDLYRLGMLLYVAWVGFPPFSGTDVHGLLYEYLNAPLPAPSSLRPGLPAPVEETILRCLARDRRHRPPEPGVLVEWLSRAHDATPTLDVTRRSGPGAP